MTLSARTLVHLPIVVVLAVCLATGFQGIDLGVQWDEPAVLHEVQESIETGLLLPRLYIYPSVRYDLALLALAPDVVRAGLAHRAQFGSGQRAFTSAVRAELREVAASHAFKLRVRGVFLIVSLAAVVLTYLAVLRWRRHWLEALTAGALVGLSWEVEYQARWIGPDGVMMAAAALTMLLLIQALGSGGAGRPVTAAAAAAGAAFSTKYPVGLLLLPVLLLVATDPEGRPGTERRGRRALRALIVFAGTYLVLSPGSVLEPVRFVGDLMGIVATYQHGNAPNQVVEAGWEHLGRNLSYLSLVLFSKYAAVSAAFFLAALLGVVAVLREGWRTAVVFFSFPVGYLAFMSLQRVMVVRNLLPLTPFLALLAARGVAVAHAQLARHRTLRPIVPLTVAAGLVLNVGWLVTAAESVRNRGSIDWTSEVRRYVEARPDTRFVFSARVADELVASMGRLPDNARRWPAGGGRAVFYASEAVRTALLANHRGRYQLLPTGPFEVNFDYYPHWVGDDRIVIVDVDTAMKFGVFAPY